MRVGSESGLTTNDARLCSNFTFWSQISCDEGRHRCSGDRSGQCAYRDGDCEDSSDTYVPSNSSDCAVRCEVKNVTKCLTSGTRCDLHPSCDGGEDEEDCEALYRQRGLISESALYSCQSPHYNDGGHTSNVSILSTRCNNVPECYLGEDELNCHNDHLYTGLGE